VAQVVTGPRCTLTGAWYVLDDRLLVEERRALVSSYAALRQAVGD